MINIGDTVRHKETGRIGKVRYSTFGMSVAGIAYNEDGSIKHRWQTLGEPRNVIEQYWEKVEEDELT